MPIEVDAHWPSLLHHILIAQSHREIHVTNDKHQWRSARVPAPKYQSTSAETNQTYWISSGYQDAWLTANCALARAKNPIGGRAKSSEKAKKPKLVGRVKSHVVQPYREVDKCNPIEAMSTKVLLIRRVGKPTSAVQRAIKFTLQNWSL